MRHALGSFCNGSVVYCVTIMLRQSFVLPISPIIFGDPMSGVLNDGVGIDVAGIWSFQKGNDVPEVHIQTVNTLSSL